MEVIQGYVHKAPDEFSYGWKLGINSGFWETAHLPLP